MSPRLHFMPCFFHSNLTSFHVRGSACLAFKKPPQSPVKFYTSQKVISFRHFIGNSYDVTYPHTDVSVIAIAQQNGKRIYKITFFIGLVQNLVASKE